MGGWTAARALMQAAGVPVEPGDNGPGGKGFATLEEARAAAGRIGFPVMLKAAAGGGGKGMRLVDSVVAKDGDGKLDEAAAAAEVGSAFQGARREAKSAFGDDTVYLGKAAVRPRLVEVEGVREP